MQRRMSKFYTSLMFLAIGQPLTAFALCVDSVKGPIVMEIQSCSMIRPELYFSANDERFQNIRQLDAKSKSQFYQSYRGMLFRGKVMSSEASRSQEGDASKGALKGEVQSFFVASPMFSACPIPGIRVSGDVDEVCCDGSAAAPCLVGTSFRLASEKSLGPASLGGGQVAKQKSLKSEDYKKADAALLKKDFKTAIEYYLKAKAAGALDPSGFYKLGYSFRSMDDCTKAIPPLRENYTLFLSKKEWTDEEKVFRANNFLLARCYAKLNQPGPSVMVLNGYLLESKKYHDELQMSLRQRDFGYIHTSKEYQDYKKSAEEKLRN